MNIYDFDGTIYDGDCSLDFYFFCLKKNFMLAKFLPEQFCGFIKFISQKISRKEFKENFFCFLRGVENTEFCVKKFWKLHKHKIKKWYLSQKQSDDIVISASPDFLLKKICNGLGVKFIATKMDIRNGKIVGENCYGAEKATRLCAELGLPKKEIEIEEFYSDTKSDEPLAKLAKKSFLVNKNKIYLWK